MLVFAKNSAFGSRLIIFQFSLYISSVLYLHFAYIIIFTIFKDISTNLARQNVPKLNIFPEYVDTLNMLENNMWV